MAENYSLMLVVWLFLILLGGCVLINAAVDLGAREFRRWLGARRRQAVKAPVMSTITREDRSR